MSLFLGNLSPRIRKEELERVFQRFGRSNVQLKDGYGFAVYDVPADAERALRALRGKIICGEQISLTWSNKQPRPFKKFTRSIGFSQPYRGRNFMREEANGVRSSGSQDQRDFTAGPKYTNHNREVPRADGGEEDIEDHEGEKGLNLKEGVLDDGGTVEHNLVENDRWGAPISDSLNDTVEENGTEFDRYEPYHGYDRRDENENHKMTSSPERAWKEHSHDRSKPQHVCYNCGLEGHILRNCPRPDGPRREKFSRFGRRRDVEITFRGRGKGRVQRAWESPNMRGDRPLTSRHMTDRKASRSGKLRRMAKKRDGLLESKENWRLRISRDSCGKKRNRKEHETPKKRRGKKARSDSSQRHSDSPAPTSRSHSPSSKSLSGISSHSRSRSRSRSSSSRSLSLSISLGRQSPSSPNGAGADATGNSPKDHLEHDMDPASKDLLLEPKHSGGDVGSEHLEPKVTGGTQKDENAGHVYDGGNHSTSRIEYLEKIPCTVPLEKIAFTAENSSSEKFREMDDLARAPLGKPNPQIPVSCQGSKSTRISPQEMCMVLKHYGLAAPEESELHLPVESYFGAARFWPWEMIYYRRLKKGPISTENYARRVTQNTEFGIVDKYIRSSSGWGEYDGSDS
ncbi:uncharacterized protein LOC131235527 isoform X2 [Magnolia sinica]|uniref:uncharacterized protein LOC131235527 isoform X2 n=1 Tax=Magnolia sinica TaxID=86752 RepID=UPI00265AD63E|nr:uncharacterized protein LOC131235527 isoform X2 [Magnolia sinica]